MRLLAVVTTLGVLLLVPQATDAGSAKPERTHAARACKGLKQPATSRERADAIRVIAASVHIAERYLLKPRSAANGRALAQSVPRPEPFNTYRNHASKPRLPLKRVHLDAFWRFGGCIDRRGDRNPANDVIDIGAGSDWTVYGDTNRLRPWPYLGTSFQFSVVGTYTVTSSRITAFASSH